MSLYRPVPPVPFALNELTIELLSINSLNPWAAHDSSSRGTMFSSSHIAQALVIEDAEPRRIQTGTEAEFGRFTFKHKLPCDVEIVRIIPKFRQTMGKDSIPENPSTLIVYEEVETKRVGILEMIGYSTAIDNKHQHFGFAYKNKPVAGELSVGMRLPKGTVLADSPSVVGEGDHQSYNYGLETNVAFMGVPGIIEDGIVVSESYLKRISSKGYEKRVTSFGKKYYPLNLYGDKENYKPFPDVGDRIRDDGLLFALRPYDELLAPIEMDPDSLMEPDHIFDKLVYAEPGGRVVDVTVHHDNTNKVPPTPVGMEAQAEKYYTAHLNYYKAVMEAYKHVNRKPYDPSRIAPEFHRLIVEAMSYVGFENNPATEFMKHKDPLVKRRVQKLYRRNEVDDWRVEVAFEYDVEPNIAFKLTELHGGKGVICDVWPDSRMPVDADGNRAEVIMDGDSTIKRMNIGRVYEQYINACSRDVTKRVREFVVGGGSIEEAYNYLLSYYRTISPKMADLMESPDYQGTPESHVKSVIDEGVYLWLPPDNPADPVESIKLLRDFFPPTHGPVTYDGGYVTDRPVLIGSLYVILLEKTGVDWSGTSSSKLQHFGIPARVSNADKYATPGRNQPVRILGEAEIRLLNAVAGSDTSADLMDQSNNPATHKAIIRRLLSSETPTNFDRIIDRREVPLGNSRSIQFVNHILECAGLEFVRELDDPIRQADVEQQLKALQKESKI